MAQSDPPIREQVVRPPPRSFAGPRTYHDEGATGPDEALGLNGAGLVVGEVSEPRQEAWYRAPGGTVKSPGGSALGQFLRISLRGCQQLTQGVAPTLHMRLRRETHQGGDPACGKAEFETQLEEQPIARWKVS